MPVLGHLSQPTCHNARTHISPTSLYEALKQGAPWVSPIRRRPHLYIDLVGTCEAAAAIKQQGSSCQSSQLLHRCITAREACICSKPHGKCKIPYHESRYLRVLSYRVVMYMSSLRWHGLPRQPRISSLSATSSQPRNQP